MERKPLSSPLSGFLIYAIRHRGDAYEHPKELGKEANLTGEWIDYEFRLQEKIEIHIPKHELSTHTARRTFIVTAINEGVSTDLIMLITSHSDYKAMKPYIKANLKGTSSVIAALDRTYSK